MTRIARAVLTLLILLSCPLFHSAAAAAVLPDIDLYGAIDRVDLDELDSFRRQIDQELGLLDQKLSVREWVMAFLRGEWEFSFSHFLQSLLDKLCHALMANSGVMGKIIILSVLASLLVHMQNSFAGGTAKIAYWSCYLGMAAVAVGSFRLALSAGQSAVDNLSGFMTAILPQMMVLIASVGNVNGSLLLYPALMATTTAFAAAVRTVVIPCIVLSAVLHIVNAVSDRVRVENMARFFFRLAQMSLGFLITVFAGFITVRTLYAAVLDKVVLRTGKFVADHAIPIVGKMLSDTLEVTAGYLMILKNAVGIYGILTLLAIILVPILQNTAVALLYSLTGAIIEPMGDGKTAAVLEAMSSHLWLLTAAMAAVGLMFLIMVALILGLTNNFTL
jgi:stage III sporulation protein AE